MESGASRFEDKKDGLFYYELRDDEEGRYRVERHVLCNNIGSMVTDKDILQDVACGFLTDEELFLRYEMVQDLDL